MDAARFYRSMWDLDAANQSIAQQAAANRAAASPQSQYQMPFSPNPPMTGVQMAQRDLPGALDVGKQINDYMLNYQRSGIPNYGGNEQALSNRITALLNPNDPTASYDVAMHGAEGAAGRGIAPGSSGLGAQLTGRLREADIERRAALGANLMGQEVSWLPKPYDPSHLLVDPTTVYTTQEQEAMERLRLGQQLSIEQARLLNDIAARRQGYGGGGGGYGYDPYRTGTTSRTPAPVAPGPTPTPKPNLTPPWTGFSEPPPAGATIYKNPDGTWGWGYVPPRENPPGVVGPMDPNQDMERPDPLLFGPDWHPGLPNPWAPEPEPGPLNDAELLGLYS